MTIDHHTDEIVGAPSYGQVNDSVRRAKSSLEDAAEQIIWQIENRAWEVLGYDSWDAMREGEYGGAAFMVPRAERPELVARMRKAGLTQQEIADTAGVHEATVSRDLANASSGETPPTITNARGQQRPASYARPEANASPKTPDADRRLVHDLAIDRAREEFPDLGYYIDNGRDRDALNMADDLRRYRERGDLDERLDNLRRSIAVDRAERDGTCRENTTAVMGEDGEYRMEPIDLPAVQTCPTCGQTVRK